MKKSSILSTTEKNHVLYKFKREPFFKKPVSEEILTEYFDMLTYKAPFYICALSFVNKNSKIYIEKTKDKSIQGIVRVFFTVNEVKNYMDIVSREENIPPKALKFWEARPSEIISALTRISNNSKTENGKGIKAIATIFDNEKLVYVDTFWSSEEKDMI